MIAFQQSFMLAVLHASWQDSKKDGFLSNILTFILSCMMA
jgi:hypothetical protein